MNVDALPSVGEDSLEDLQIMFFRQFHEVIWNRDLTNISQFAAFQTEADRILYLLIYRLEFANFLLQSKFINEEIFLNNDFLSIGEIIGSQILGQKAAFFVNLEPTQIILQILEQFGTDYVDIEENNYRLNCLKCKMCTTPDCCFYEGLLNSLSQLLNSEVEIYHYSEKLSEDS